MPIDILLPFLLLFLQHKKNFIDIIYNVVRLNLFILIVVTSVLYEGNIELAVAIFIRSNLMLLFVLAVFYSSDFFEIARVSYYFRLPRKLILTLYFTLRSILTLKSQKKSVFESIRFRGFEKSFDIFTYRTYAYAIAQIVRKSHRKSESINTSLELRGYDNYSIFFKPYSSIFRVKDGVFLSIFIIFLVVNLCHAL